MGDAWLPCVRSINPHDTTVLNTFSLEAILYVLVKGLIETVGPEFSFYTSRQVSRLAPEVTSVGATISTLKIIYGFDGRPRFVIIYICSQITSSLPALISIAGEDDPALAMPTFEAYMTSLQKHWDARLDTEDELYSPMTTVYADPIL